MKARVQRIPYRLLSVPALCLAAFAIAPTTMTAPTYRRSAFRKAPGVYSKDLIEVIFRQPYTKIQFVVDAGIAKRQTASTYLQTLAGLGVLRESKQGREKYYINDALFAELAA